MNVISKDSYYIYNYACAEEEIPLCALEIRSLFGKDSLSQYNSIESHLLIDPSRSPFISGRLDVMFQSENIKDLLEQVNTMSELASSFKVLFVKNRGDSSKARINYENRNEIIRQVANNIRGKADMHHPEIQFAVMFVKGKWLFGPYKENQAVWLKHKSKPYNYSTALNTRVARAVINIAVPDPKGIKVIDPCCGIGTVLIEALSMGIDIVGSDINPLIMKGIRENIAYFGYKAEVRIEDICSIEEEYDVAIIDLPYNLCSVLPEEVKVQMIQNARRFTKKLVVITIEPIDTILIKSGFTIVDRCELRKRNFARQVIVCS
ncbi:TRM11 family SAM-dependent methyltransferase [Aquibacillus kalidii]|uniref:TRM11 family SAM-dependent methyltransferase n=1 Tax=Aquibacillus kalidii TaxID=2762597 RepID=UPI002E2BA055|nr:methyltransferase domain-containing protein [Aquibacillus kalidii]